MVTNRIVAVTACVTIKRLETNGGVSKASGKTEELVEAAGSSAGLVQACGVDPTPISAAVNDLLKRVPLSPSAEAAVLVSYQANETRMTRNTLAIPGAPPCGDIRILVQDTVRHLNAIGQPDSAMPTTTVSSLDD